MKLNKIKEILNARIICNNSLLNRDIEMACGSDLLSDVLAFTKTGALLLTGLVNIQVIRTAEMIDISAVCFVRGKVPDNKVIAMAKEKKIPLLCVKYPMYEACGRLYKNGLPGCSEK
jgi:predicted transcriptional regulator